MADRQLPSVTTPTSQAQVQPLAQVRVDTSSISQAIGGIFRTAADAAHQAADISAARAAQEQAALDIRDNPDGVPALRPGTSIRAQNYNKTARDLFSLKLDSQATQQFNALEEEHSGNPAVYQESTNAYLQGVLAKTDSFDPALSIKVQAKYEQIQAAGIRKLQKQAAIQIAAEHVDQLELSSNLLLNEADELSASLYDMSEGAESLERMGQLFEELRTNLNAVNPLTGERYVPESEAVEALKNLQERVTFFGLIAEIRRSDDDMLDLMKDQIETQGFGILIYDENSDSALVELQLEAVLSPEKIGNLLSKIDEEQRSRRMEATKLAFGIESAMKSRLEDVNAQAELTGSGEFPSIQELVASNFSESQVFSAAKSYDQAKMNHRAKSIASTSVPGEMELLIQRAESIQEEGGDSAAEASQFVSAMEEQRTQKIKAFSGEGRGVGSNAADWMRNHVPAVQDAFSSLGAGASSLAEYYGVLDNEYDAQQTPQQDRKYLTEDEARKLGGTFPSRDIFMDLKPDDPLGTFGEGIAQAARTLRTEFGPTGKLFSVTNQLFQGSGLPLSTMTILQIPENDFQAQNDYANALDRSTDIKDLVTSDMRNRIKEEIPEALEDFMTSLVPSQSGTSGVLRGMREGIEMFAADKMILDPSLSEEEAVAAGTQLFLSQYDFVPLRRGSSLRVDITRPFSKLKLQRGSNHVSTMIVSGDISALISTFGVKDKQEVSDSEAAYSVFIGRGGALKTLSQDENTVGVFAPDGSQTLYEGEDGGIRALTFTLDELEELGGLIPSKSILAATAQFAPVSALRQIREQDVAIELWLKKVFDRQLQEPPRFPSQEE